MPEPIQIIWSDEPDGNVAHLAEHGVTVDEADGIIRRYFGDRQPSRSRPDRWVLQGYTAAGRYLVVVLDYLEDLDTVIPITAFEPVN